MKAHRPSAARRHQGVCSEGCLDRSGRPALPTQPVLGCSPAQQTRCGAPSRVGRSNED